MRERRRYGVARGRRWCARNHGSSSVPAFDLLCSMCATCSGLGLCSGLPSTACSTTTTGPCSSSRMSYSCPRSTIPALLGLGLGSASGRGSEDDTAAIGGGGLVEKKADDTLATPSMRRSCGERWQRRWAGDVAFSFYGSREQIAVRGQEVTRSLTTRSTKPGSQKNKTTPLVF